MLLSLDDYNFGDKRYMVAVLAIELAMDHKPSNREMTSLLLSDLYQRFLTGRDMEKGAHYNLSLINSRLKWSSIPYSFKYF